MTQRFAHPAPATTQDAVAPALRHAADEADVAGRQPDALAAAREAANSAVAPVPTVPAQAAVPVCGPADRQLLSDAEWQALLWPRPEGSETRTGRDPGQACAAGARS